MVVRKIGDGEAGDDHFPDFQGAETVRAEGVTSVWNRRICPPGFEPGIDRDVECLQLGYTVVQLVVLVGHTRIPNTERRGFVCRPG